MSADGVGAEVASFTCFAVSANPDVVELVHCLLHDFGVVGEDAGLKVAFVVVLHADAGAGEVRAAHIDFLAVEDEHLEMDTGTEHPFETIVENRVFVEVLTEVRTGFFGMNQTHLHTPPDELSYQSEKGFLLFANVNIEILDVSSANPKRVFHGLDA